MGMGQYLVATVESLSAENPGEAPWKEPEGWTWRKHYPLAEFIAHNANCVLDFEDDSTDGTYAVTAELLDGLEEALTSEAGLPQSCHDPDRSPRDTAYDLEAVQWARERLSDDKYVYCRVSY